MIERMARQLFKSQAARLAARFGHEPMTWAECPEPWKTELRTDVRALLAEMREPSPPMKAAMGDTPAMHSPFEPSRSGPWRAAIDAAYRDTGTDS